MTSSLIHDSSEFRQLMERLRQGDPSAAETVVSRYGQHIAHAVRRRIRSRHILALYDTDDCVQSVWAAVFDNVDRLARLESPQDLIRFLSHLACCRLVDCHRRLYADRQDVSRNVPLPGSESADRMSLADHDPTPSQAAEFRDEWDHTLNQLPSERKRILEMYRDGHTSSEIADVTGRTGRGIRYILQRIGLMGESDRESRQ